MNVMNAVTMVVDSLNDSSTLVQELKNLGESHGKHNIQESHFRVSWCSCSLICDCRVYVCITICHDCLSTTEFGGGSRCLPGERSRPATLPRTRQTKLDQSVGRGRQRRCDWIAAAVTRCHRGIDRVKTKTKTKKPVNAGFPFLKNMDLLFVCVIGHIRALFVVFHIVFSIFLLYIETKLAVCFLVLPYIRVHPHHRAWLCRFPVNHVKSHHYHPVTSPQPIV